MSRVRLSSDTVDALSPTPAPAPTRRPLWAASRRRTNRMATASLVFGLLWLGGLGSVAAVLCGHWGHRQIAERWQRGAARATLGIRLGWVGILATGVLAILVTYTPEQLGYQLDQVERTVRLFF